MSNATVKRKTPPPTQRARLEAEIGSSYYSSIECVACGETLDEADTNKDRTRSVVLNKAVRDGWKVVFSHRHGEEGALCRRCYEENGAYE